MEAQQTRLWRGIRYRFEREPGSRLIDAYRADSTVPSTLGMSDFIAIYADMGAVIDAFHEEQADLALVRTLGIRDAGRSRDDHAAAS